MQTKLLRDRESNRETKGTCVTINLVSPHPQLPELDNVLLTIA